MENIFLIGFACVLILLLIVHELYSQYKMDKQMKAWDEWLREEKIREQAHRRVLQLKEVQKEKSSQAHKELDTTFGDLLD